MSPGHLCRSCQLVVMSPGHLCTSCQLLVMSPDQYFENYSIQYITTELSAGIESRVV